MAVLLPGAWPWTARAADGPVAEPAPAMLLANEWQSGLDPARYLVSEKYDGVRALWDGRRLQLRGGGAVAAPAWFTERLPGHALDGELWIARGQFERVSGLVRTEAPNDEAWKAVKYMVFELPGAPGSFAERAAGIEAIVARANWPQLIAVRQFRVADRAELQHRLDAVVRAGGEGLMLHLAGAPYATGRSDVLLKLKPLQDAEAQVIAHQPGKGKYTGQLGALKVRTPDGRVFAIGTGFTDAQRAAPPAVGTTITYTYRGLTASGLPRFASFLRRRDAL